MFKRIKIKNFLLLILGMSLFTAFTGVILYVLGMVLFFLAILAKVVGALLIGYNSYHIFKQIKNDEKDD